MARATYLHLIWQGQQLLGIWTVKREMEKDIQWLGLKEDEYRYERRMDGEIEQRQARWKARTDAGK